jgi:hypothetical protein
MTLSLVSIEESSLVSVAEAVFSGDSGMVERWIPTLEVYGFLET